MLYLYRLSGVKGTPFHCCHVRVVQTCLCCHIRIVQACSAYTPNPYRRVLRPRRIVQLVSSYLLLCTVAGVRSPLPQIRRDAPIPLTTVAPYSGGQRYGRDESHRTFPHAL